MKRLIVSTANSLICIGIIGLALFLLAYTAGGMGCTATPWNTATSVLGGTPPGTTTQTIVVPPSTQPTTVNENGKPVVIPASTQPTIINITIPPTTQQSIGTTVQTAAPIAGELIPAPWGSIVAFAMTIVSGILLKKYTTAASTITAATPGIVQLVSQAIDGVHLPSDITHISQVAAGVTQLLASSHATPTVNAINTLTSSVAAQVASQPVVAVIPDDKTKTV